MVVVGVVDDVARPEDAGGPGVRHVRMGNTSYQMARRRRGMSEGESPVGRDGEGNGVVPAFEVPLGRTPARVRVSLVLIVDEREHLLAVQSVGGA